MLQVTKKVKETFPKISLRSVRSQSFSGPYFPVFELNMGKYGPE